jgi:2-keto-4-pentenoate hydratase/2-oxohepta-3-ene-1,7-dioic acid hydratase in catechol pathway
MHLLSFGPVGAERPGILSADGDWITPIAALDATFPTTMRGLLAGGYIARLQRLAQVATAATTTRIACKTVRIGPPVTDPGKIICVGLNYRGHATEQNKPWPEQPLLFSKPTTALCGAFDTIVLPADNCGPDYEVELVVVIGKGGKQIAQSSASDHIAGYCIGNDISGRYWQKSDVQYFRAKGCDTFFPCGPYLVTADQIPDPTVLRLTTTLTERNDANSSVTSALMQDATVADLIHDIPTLIAYISRNMRLEPGDLISTGTPAGVGCYRKPPRFLRAGDIVTCSIVGPQAASQNLGQLINPVASSSE